MALIVLGCENHTGFNYKTPQASDFIITGTGKVAYDGTPKIVKVTAKKGSTTGRITVKYDGDTAPPTEEGTYKITFFAEAAKGWNAVKGFAGTLVITPALDPPAPPDPGNPAELQNPAAGDFNITGTGVFLYDGSPKTVTITPKQGKSRGTVTVYYEGTGGTAYSKSADAPCDDGNYIVSFDVAAAEGWNAASGLDAGVLSISARLLTIEPVPAQTYTGSAITPALIVKCDDVQLVPGTDYAVSYANNTNAGTAEAVITGTGAYAGITGNAAFTIIRADPAAGDFEIGNLEQAEGAVSAVTITPKPGKSPGTVTVKYSGSAALPTGAGTYAVTFDAEETPNWNAAAGLSGGTLTVAYNPETPYVITGSASAFTARRNGLIVGTADRPVQTVIDGVRSHAAGRDCAIQFGENAAVLNIGANYARFNSAGGDWGMIKLTGKITGSVPGSAPGTVVIEDTVSLSSAADIANSAANGNAVFNASVEAVNISGGAVPRQRARPCTTPPPAR